MIPDDYLECVYAGVLGKLIGVYVGRPFEGWPHATIEERLGEIDYYVNDRLGVPLIVTDDDITGTFTFLRALADHGCSPDLTPAQIGHTWLNYIIENRTILWWGGLGNSTEHTAFLRIKSGTEAPQSGSAAINGKVVSEQIGAQIFIDGWAMVAPGDPARAADFARRAASVSHDGEAIYAAQVIAAMESLAFVEKDLNALLDCGLSFIPADSVIATMIADLRRWHAEDPNWRANRARLEARYGYERYGGNCHVVPNHGLIILALLHGEGDFGRSLMIVNTCGWDTDCNSGNVGCLLGIRSGLSAFEGGPDWRGPVADRLYLPTADGGRAITDALSEAYRIANVGRSLAGLAAESPKNGARFHFSLPGSVQGWQPDGTPLDVVRVCNESERLKITFNNVRPFRVACVSTPTFVPPESLEMKGYTLIASPKLYPGQRLTARIGRDADQRGDVSVRLYINVYNSEDKLDRVYGPETDLGPGTERTSDWMIPDCAGYPIAAVGIEVASERPASGAIWLDCLTWSGVPTVTWKRTAGGNAWRRAWVDAVDVFESWSEPYRLIQNRGAGMLIQGEREWTDYTVASVITPHLAMSFGVAIRVQGLLRHYALLLRRSGEAKIEKSFGAARRTLATVPFECEFGRPYSFRFRAEGARLVGCIDDIELFDIVDTDHPLLEGAVGLCVKCGRISSESVTVAP